VAVVEQVVLKLHQVKLLVLELLIQLRLAQAVQQFKQLVLTQLLEIMEMHHQFQVQD
jgi:hypothetical protein